MDFVIPVFNPVFLGLTFPKDNENPCGLHIRSATNVAPVGAFLPRVYSIYYSIII